MQCDILVKIHLEKEINMAYWFTIPEHIAMLLIMLFFIIIVEGIVIFRLLKLRKQKQGTDEIENKIERYRDFWGEFVIYVLATSVVGIFIASLVKRDNITLADINSWVSIVLGLVALIVGIISLWLSFYNVDQASKSQNVIVQTAENVKATRTGWQEINGEWYYFDLDGKVVRNEWKKSGNNWYHLGFDGGIEKNKCVFDNGVIYYVNDDGVKVNNTFVEINGKRRYFGKDGKAVMDGEIEIDGRKYVFKDGYVVKE